MKRFLLVDIAPPRSTAIDCDDRIYELTELVSTYGAAQVVKIVQKRAHTDKSTFVGAGKVVEIGELCKKEKIDVVVLNELVNPTIIHNLWKKLWEFRSDIAVWDRVDLILSIFNKHAKTAEAKLQIEIAQMRHMGPRIYGMGHILSRQGGGVGTRGIGETNTELMKRHWRDAISATRQKLVKLKNVRQTQIDHRQDMGLKTVAIVGYTNAGKSSLFNALTKKQNLAKDALFATLDSTVAKCRLPKSGQTVLLSDTIGFIKDLPPSLIEAFKSTLMASLSAEHIIHLVDISDLKFEEKITVVKEILAELDCTTPATMVFNKIDKATQLTSTKLQKIKKEFNPIFISAKTGEGITELLNGIETRFKQKEQVATGKGSH